jgi:hypothetical protein
MEIANTIDLGYHEPVKVIQYRAIKINKSSIEYETTSEFGQSIFKSDKAKIELFRGFSRATGCTYVFRVKTLSNWNKCKPVTNLWATPLKNTFYGDLRDGITKTLIIFRVTDEEFSDLVLYVFPRGTYPRNDINRIAARL